MHTIKNIVRYFVLVLVAVIFIFPLIWTVYNSFKTQTELFLNPWALPTKLNLENYIYALENVNLLQYFRNSIFVCGVALGLSLVLSTMASFALTRLEWKLSGTVMGMFVVGMMLPLHVTLIPLFIMFSKIGIVNTYWALIVPYTTSALPMAIFILAGFFRSFPAEIEESAVIDGATMRVVFTRILLPIAKPSIATVAIYSFVSMWNELNYALVFMSSKSKMTLPIGLTYFKGEHSTDYAPMLAAVVFVAAPVILVYCVLNKQIMEGMVAGAVKG